MHGPVRGPVLGCMGLCSERTPRPLARALSFLDLDLQLRPCRCVRLVPSPYGMHREVATGSDLNHPGTSRFTIGSI